MARMKVSGRRRLASAPMFAIVVAALAGPANAATGIEALCDANDGIMGDTAEICECGLAGLRDVVPADTFEIYADVSAKFLDGRAEGLGLVEAWDAGVTAEAGERGVSATRILEATNPAGRAHRDAIRDCEAS